MASNEWYHYAIPLYSGHGEEISEMKFMKYNFVEVSGHNRKVSRNLSFCSARDWDGKDYLRIIPRVVW
jgi:hypothetical protein